MSAPPTGRGKTDFVPYPKRALSDPRFTATLFRTLGVICMHDRLSDHRVSGKRGQGCWASNATLAKEANINYTNLSTALTELAEWGYITRERHPVNKRLRIYRVVYDALPRNKESGAVADADASSCGKHSGLRDGDSCTDASDPVQAGILCPEKINSQPSQGDSHVEYIPLKREENTLKRKDIPLKREHILHKQEINSPEGARPLRGGGGWRSLLPDNPGGALAQLERHLGLGNVLQADDQSLIESILDQAESDEPISHQAARLLEKWGVA